MKRIPIFLSGMIMGAALFGSALCYAELGTKNIAAEYSDIKMVVEGGLVKTSLEPFIFNDRTYVPLRVVAEAMKKEVGWEDNTVLIGSGKQSLLLTDLLVPSVTAVTCFNSSSIKVNGTSYEHGFTVLGKEGRPTGSVSFSVIDKGIKEIGGTLAMDDKSPEKTPPVEITVLKDGKKIWEGAVKRGDNPIPMNITLEENTRSLEFQFNCDAVAQVDFIDFKARY